MNLNYIRIDILLHHCIATCTALLLCVVSVAQVKFSTVVTEREPSLDDYVQVEYTIENAKNVEKVSAPPFNNFRIIQGPMQSDGMSYMNGALSEYKSVLYVLQPLVKGKLVIPGATAIIDGKPMQSENVFLNVKASAGIKKNNSNLSPSAPLPVWPQEPPEVEAEYVLKPGESFADKIKKNMLVKTEVNKTTCYEGEPIMATSKLFSRLRSESRVLKRPSLNGFSVYDMIEPDATGNPTVEPVNGKPFNVHIIRKTQLFPLQPGTIIIDPVELDNTVRFLKTEASQPPKSRIQQLMDEFMNDSPQRGEIEEHSFTLASKPVTITVKPLPVAGKPVGFNGAVGKFSLQAHLDKKSVAAGDALVLQLDVKGEGNFTMINAPVLPLPKGIDVYDPEIKENVDKGVYPLQGSKTFEYTLIAKQSGDYEIPPVSFSYFNPSEAAYKTEKSDSFFIHVGQPVKRKSSHNGNGAITGATLPFNLGETNPFRAMLLIAGVLFVASLSFYQLRKNKVKVKPAKPVSGSAPLVEAEKAPVKTDPLDAARMALEEANSQQFYSEINKAVWTKVSEKTNIPATSLNKFNASAQLQRKGVDTVMIVQLELLLNECEIALYTPVHSTSDMQHTLLKAEQVINAI